MSEYEDSAFNIHRTCINGLNCPVNIKYTALSAPYPCSPISASLPSSVELEEFEIVEEPSRDFISPITLDLLREPHKVLYCGSHISPEAIAMVQKSGYPCPMCKEASLKSVP